MTWRVKDYADGWVAYDTEDEARASEEAQNGATVEGPPREEWQASLARLVGKLAEKEAEIERLRRENLHLKAALARVASAEPFAPKSQLRADAEAALRETALWKLCYEG